MAIWADGFEVIKYLGRIFFKKWEGKLSILWKMKKSPNIYQSNLDFWINLISFTRKKEAKRMHGNKLKKTLGWKNEAK